MKPGPSPLFSIFAGLGLTLAHLLIAILFLAPEGSFSFRYHALVQHDSYWFGNIVTRGYNTIVPPSDHKIMEVCNVGFFPAYPVLVAVLHHGLGLDLYDALLVVAQAATWGFWSYFFLFGERWQISRRAQLFGALAIVAHPAAFFLIAGYSESLFLMMLLGFIYWSSAEGRTAKYLAILHGFIMSATRIVGIPCAAFPVVRAVFQNGFRGLREVGAWWRNYGRALVIMCCSIGGAISFFIYCFVRWGRWDIYMLTQESGWAIDPDYFAVFKAESYRWLIPALRNPREASQMTMTLGALMLVAVALCEILPALRRRTAWPARLGIYFCAATIFYVSVSGVACVEMESMLRYEFCVHALIVLAFLHFLHQLPALSSRLRGCGFGAVALLSAAGFSLQGWYLWNFLRGGWVA